MKLTQQSPRFVRWFRHCHSHGERKAARRQGLAVDGAAVTGALAKIERALPEALRRELQSLRAAVSSAPYAPTPPPRAADTR